MARDAGNAKGHTVVLDLVLGRNTTRTIGPRARGIASTAISERSRSPGRRGDCTRYNCGRCAVREIRGGGRRDRDGLFVCRGALATAADRTNPSGARSMGTAGRRWAHSRGAILRVLLSSIALLAFASGCLQLLAAKQEQA